MTVVIKPSQIKLIIENLQANAIGIIPTDTVYGLVAGTLDYHSCEQIKILKNRPLTDEISVLVADKKMLERLIKIDDVLSDWFDSLPFSVTLIGYKKASASKLSLGTTLGARVPRDEWLQNLLKVTGPIWATSVNFHHQPILRKDQDLINFGADFVVLQKQISQSKLQPSRIYNLITRTWIR